MKRDKEISFYVTEKRKEKLERRAEEADTTLSSYVNTLVDRQLLDEAQGDVAVETRAVEQLQEVIDRGTRQLRDVSKDVHEMQAKTGVYGITAFLLMEREYSDKVVDQAFETAARRLQQDLPEIPTDEDEDDGDILDRIE